MSYLILIRHGQSAWNAANKFTGWVDVPLSQKGLAEAAQAAEKLKAYPVDVCFTSLLVRSMQTAMICLVGMDIVTRQGKCPVVYHAADDPNWHGWDAHTGNPGEEIPVFPAQALDERFYGDLQGLNKAETAQKYGDEQVRLWRRSYSVRPPGGESLEDTVARTVPFFQSRILTHVKAGEHVMVSAHGNSLRAIIMHLEQVSQAAIPNLELATGVPIIYDIDREGNLLNKQILTQPIAAIG